MVWVHDITLKPAKALDMRLSDHLELAPHQPPQVIKKPHY